MTAWSSCNYLPSWEATGCTGDDQEVHFLFSVQLQNLHKQWNGTVTETIVCRLKAPKSESGFGGQFIFGTDLGCGPECGSY